MARSLDPTTVSTEVAILLKAAGVLKICYSAYSGRPRLDRGPFGRYWFVYDKPPKRSRFLSAWLNTVTCSGVSCVTLRKGCVGTHGLGEAAELQVPRCVELQGLAGAQLAHGVGHEDPAGIGTGTQTSR